MEQGNCAPRNRVSDAYLAILLTLPDSSLIGREWHSAVSCSRALPERMCAASKGCTRRAQVLCDPVFPTLLANRLTVSSSTRRSMSAKVVSVSGDAATHRTMSETCRRTAERHQWLHSPMTMDPAYYIEYSLCGFSEWQATPCDFSRPFPPILPHADLRTMLSNPPRVVVEAPATCDVTAASKNLQLADLCQFHSSEGPCSRTLPEYLNAHRHDLFRMETSPGNINRLQELFMQVG